MNGLEQRVARHLRKDKKMHWHIDYLLKKAKILEVVSFQTSYSNDECLAQTAPKLGITRQTTLVSGAQRQQAMHVK